jgi:hypothetical protein
VDDFTKTLETVKNSELALKNFDIDLHEVYRDGRPPVSIQQFLDDDYYLGKAGKDIYPDNRPDIEDIFDPEKNYAEVILAGSIGWGKTYLVCLGLCYMVYQLSCYVNPHKWLGSAPTSPIVFINMSVTQVKARTVIFQRLKNLVDQSPYFKEKFIRNMRLKDTLEWSIEQQELGSRSGRQIIHKPGTGEGLSALGDDIFGGVIDEANFFKVVEKSKKAVDGGVFDPAQSVYNTVSRRMISRFMGGGKMLGKLFLISSATIPDDFIERRISEAEEANQLGTSVKVIRKNWWTGKRDLDKIGKPKAYGDKRFRVEVGTAQKNSRILDSYDQKTGDIKEVVPDDECTGKIIKPPIELWYEFYRDVDGGVREFGGEVTRAVSPYIRDVELIYDSATRGREKGLEHPWSAEETTLADGSHLMIEHMFEKVDVINDNTGEVRKKWQLKRHPKRPRYFHVDIALSGDALGLAVVHQVGWKRVFRGFGIEEELPVFEVDLMLRVKAPAGGEINLGNVRAVLFDLKQHGVHLRLGTFDHRAMGADSLQILQSRGFEVDYLSVDRKREDKNDDPYEVLKDTIYDARLDMYYYTPAIDELTRLEKTPDKVDHPARGSKDVADALAGAVFNAFMDTLHSSPSRLDGALPSVIGEEEKDTLARRRAKEEADFVAILRAGRLKK